MMNTQQVDFLDFEPRTQSILKEVLAGLSQTPKTLSPKLLYDKRGSEIFEQICFLKEYYPTRAETEILLQNSQEMAELIGPNALIIEPGSGAGEKVRPLLRVLDRPTGYMPIEISKDILLRMTDEFLDEFPDLPLYPICADFSQDIELSSQVRSAEKKVIFFPGSTIGNLTPAEAISFLKRYGKVIGDGGGVLIGVDLKKEKEIFEAAYDDSEGVTAQFNLNLLERLNREVEAEFNPSMFRHRAIYNEELGRVEMHLVSEADQLVKVNQTIFRFREGESIHTESSYKYSVPEFAELCAKARLSLKRIWQDRRRLFCVYYFERES